MQRDEKCSHFHFSFLCAARVSSELCEEQKSVSLGRCVCLAQQEGKSPLLTQFCVSGLGCSCTGSGMGAVPAAFQFSGVKRPS